MREAEERCIQFRLFRAEFDRLWKEAEDKGTNDYSQVTEHVKKNVMLETDDPKQPCPRILPRPASGYTDCIPGEPGLLLHRFIQMERWYEW
mmetsp:Transcript_29013/g.38664  ORF Transcript_29013/g.38664 Transcript_29013/m.38664 type:complete len:91 (+) Transcript_29013:93-365(+)